MPAADARAFVAARHGDPIEVTDASVIRVHFFVKQFFKRGRWLIVRPGTPGVMLTTDDGLRALRMFRRGAVLRDVKAALGKDAGFAPDCVNLAPLVAAAASAGLVASVDGAAVRAPALDPRRLWIHWMKIVVYPYLYAAMDRCPMAIRERLLFHLQWFFEGRFRYDAERLRTLNNLQLLFPDERPAALEARTLEFHTERVRNDLAFRTTGKRLTRVFRWLDVFLHEEVAGADLFRRCLDRHKGVVVVSFHFGCYWMMPALLLKMGLRVHVVVGSVSERERLIERAVVPGAPRAKLKFYDSSVRGFVDLARVLREGDVVLLFADTHGLGDTPVQQFVHQSWGKAALARSQATLCGYPFPVEGTVSWLHRQNASPVIPAVLYPMTDTGKVRLEFGQPAGLDAAPLTEDAITRVVYGHLEQWVTRMPEQWAYLNAFPGERARAGILSIGGTR